MAKRIKPIFKNVRDLKDGYYWANVLYSDQKTKDRVIISIEVYDDSFSLYGFMDNDELSTTKTTMGMQVKSIYTKRIKFHKGK